MARFLLTAQLQLRAPANTRQVVGQIRRQLQGGVNVNVNLNAANANRQAQKLTSNVNAANNAGQKLNRTFATSLKRFAAFSIASRGITLFTSRLSAGIEAAIDFERELVKISQVTGKTMSELQGLSNTITNLSTSLGTSSKSLLSTGRILAQAGIQARDLDVALAALAKTTLAPTFDDISKTAEGAVAILAQFGKGVDALESQLGAINAVAGQFAVESGDLISAVRRTGGVFKSAGGDLNELIGLFTSVRATTRESAESIATGLRTIFTRIQRPKTIEFLKQFGVELTDLNGKFVGPFEAVRQLSRAFKGLEEGDITFVRVAEELGGFRQIGKVIPLLQQFETAERARAAAVKGATSLDRDAATAQQALAVQIEKTREKFLQLVRELANTGTFKSLVSSVLGLADAFIRVADALKPILPLVGALAGIKLAGFLGGAARGLGASIATRNAGGPIGFNSGGLVPGHGNTDTVPAMLTAGEFVIRKSSVRKIGAKNLAAMNARGYNFGGPVVEEAGEYPDSRGYSVPAKYSFAKGQKTAFDKKINRFNSDDKLRFFRRPDERVDVNLLYAGRKRSSLYQNYANAVRTGNNFARGNAFEKIIESEKGVKLSVRNRGEAKNDAPSSRLDGIRGGIPIEIKSRAEVISNRELGKKVAGASLNDNPSSADRKMVNRLKNQELTNSKTTKKPDVVNFGSVQVIADETNLAAIKGSTDNRILGKTPKLRNSGGGIPGSDTVPAMLTPGEFVINKSAAKQIGTANLNRMNKHGVAGFAAGGMVRSGRNNYGVPTSMQIGVGGGNFIDANSSNTDIKKAREENSKQIEKSTKASKGMTKSHKMADASGKAMGLMMAASMIPRFEDTGNAAKATANSMLDMVTQLSMVGFALQAFGVKLSLAGANPGMSLGRAGFGGQAVTGRFQSAKVIGRGGALGARKGARLGGKLGGVGRVAGGVGGAAVGAGSAGAGLIAGAIGPIVATGAAAAALGIALDNITGVHKEAEVAIKSGNAARAEETALMSKNASGSTALAVGGTVAAAAIAALAGATLPVVGIIGGIAAVGFTLFKGLGLLDGTVSAIRKTLVLFGGASEETIKAQAAQKAVIVAEEKLRKKNNSNLERAQKKGDRAGIAEAFGKNAASFAREDAAKARELSSQLNDARSARRTRDTFFGFSGPSATEKDLIKQQQELTQQGRDRAGQNLQNILGFESVQKQIRIAGATGKSIDAKSLASEFGIDFKDADPEAVNNFIEDINNMGKAAKRNADQMKALNFGLANVNAAAEGASSALDRFLESRQTGTFDSVSVLDQALSSAASSLDPKELQRAQNELASTMRGFGASQSQIDQSTQSIGAIAQLQRVGERVFKIAGETAGARDRTKPQQVLDDVRVALRSQLGAFPADIREKVLGGLGEIDGELLTEALETGNFGKVFQASLEPLIKAQQEGALKLQKTQQENDKKLAGLYKERIDNERQFIEAQKKSIELQKEAASLIAEFSGRELTSKERVGFAEREARLGLGANANLSAAGLVARSRVAAQQVIGGRQAFANGFSDPRQAAIVQGRIQSAESDQEEILAFARERIKIYKDEIAAAKEKLKLDQEAAKAALGGDSMAQLEATLASIARDAFVSGNTAVLKNVGGDARIKGFEALSEEERKRTGGTLRRLGLSGRLAGSLTESTPEISKLESEATKMAKVISEVGKSLESIAKNKFDRTNIDIQTAQISIGQAVGRQRAAAPPTRTQYPSRGGVIYANNGIFVPRGTDTVPAMLTPGEFVVNRAAVQRGNNLQILRAMNNGGAQAKGYSRGGVAYMSDGDEVLRNSGMALNFSDGSGSGSGGSFSESITKMTKSLSSFSDAVNRLTGFEFKLKLDPVNITVSINSGALNDNIKDEVLTAVAEEITINQLGKLERPRRTTRGFGGTA